MIKWRSRSSKDGGKIMPEENDESKEGDHCQTREGRKVMQMSSKFL